MALAVINFEHARTVSKGGNNVNKCSRCGNTGGGKYLGTEIKSGDSHLGDPSSFGFLIQRALPSFGLYWCDCDPVRDLSVSWSALTLRKKGTLVQKQLADIT